MNLISLITANSVAHALSRFARLIDNKIVWIEEDGECFVFGL